MGLAKKIVIKPIAPSDSNAICKKLHYSGKAGSNVQLHLGVFLDGRCGGVMQFGPSMDKSKTIGLVTGTKWNSFLELNRMAFADWLPRNSESRALAQAMKIIRKNYPHIEWIISYSDATQCGDGTIYRASGFVLTQIRENETMYSMPDGFVFANIGLTASSTNLKKKIGFKTGETVASFCKRTGAIKLKGFQLRYIYFLNESARKRLAVPVVPFSEISKLGASMYRGKNINSASSSMVERHVTNVEVGGSNPTLALNENG